MILKYQKEAISSEAGVPFIYGNDQVHGLAGCRGAVIFPHNIGIGAANDKELTYQMDWQWQMKQNSQGCFGAFPRVYLQHRTPDGDVPMRAFLLKTVWLQNWEHPIPGID